jgi:transcription antitermination factor NusB
VQMLYQWEVGRLSMLEVMSTYWPLRDSGTAASRAEPEGDEPAAAADAANPDRSIPRGEETREFATALATGVAASIERLDPLIAEAAEHWRIERMPVMDRIVLRLAVFEFLEQPQTPARVIINEALELARTFSTDDAVRFVNGVLDRIRRTLQRE